MAEEQHLIIFHSKNEVKHKLHFISENSKWNTSRIDECQDQGSS